jgi:hypothetical protein
MTSPICSVTSSPEHRAGCFVLSSRNEISLVPLHIFPEYLPLVLTLLPSARRTELMRRVKEQSQQQWPRQAFVARIRDIVPFV